MAIRIPIDAIHLWAARYDYPIEPTVEELVEPVRQAGELNREQMLTVGYWKSPRIIRKLEANEDLLVREATRIALSATSEELRIGAPMLINGVGWPVSSVILHWFHRDPYPLIDYRALWSMGMDGSGVYSVPFWMRYVEATRELAANANVSMRELDRALWQFSKENQ